MSNIPSWWQFLLLALAAYRIFRLLAEDTLLDRPRRALLKLDPNWQEDGDYTGERYREKWGLFLTCPYCAGFWIALLWWLAWLLWPHATVLLAVPAALSAVVALLAKTDEKLNS